VDELGVDSLVAVEIRSWYLQELFVDVPVLKILGRASVGELLDYALERLPKELTPALADADTLSAPLESFSDKSSRASSVAATSSIKTEESSLMTSSDTPIKNTSTPISVNFPQPQTHQKPTERHYATQREERMSFGQSRFWFLGRYLEDQTTFNVSCCLTLTGSLRVGDLVRAVEVVGQRHESLRTRFFASEDQLLMQSIMESSTLALECKKIPDAATAANEFAALKRHVYDLETGETMRMMLLSQSPNSHFLMVGYHHINMDGISLQILLSDISKIYRGQSLNTNILQYPDFSTRQRNALGTGEMKDDLIWWQKQFPDIHQSYQFYLSRIPLLVDL
jgi:hybrid polyketide synthase / nonribosomal peptide synthetase ACE1